MNYRINQPVVTPIGEGVFQGKMDFYAFDKIEMLMLVRVKLDGETSKHLRDSNCLTPRASESGLWTFKPEELR